MNWYRSAGCRVMRVSSGACAGAEPARARTQTKVSPAFSVPRPFSSTRTKNVFQCDGMLHNVSQELALAAQETDLSSMLQAAETSNRRFRRTLSFPIRYTRSVMRNCVELLLAAALVAAAGWAGEIILPANALERDAPIEAIYRTNGLATGKGALSITWTDVHGRTVDERKIPVELTDEEQIGFPLDLRRAAAMKNTLRVHFSFEGRNKKDEPDKREEDAETVFIAKPPDRAWRDYMIIMWQDYPAGQQRLLKTLGINAGQYVGRNRTLPDFLLDNDLRWYAENIATDFYSTYHRWAPDRPVNWM